MKAQVNFTCEFEEIPEMVEDLIFSVWNRSHGKLGDLLSMAKKSSHENPLKALEEIDNVRKELKKMDDRLLDCVSILTGYIKAQTDMKSGQEINTISPEVVEETNENIASDFSRWLELRKFALESKQL